MFLSLHPNIRLRIVLSFFSKLMGSMIFPFMAIYFSKLINPFSASIIITLQLILQLVISLYGGFLSDILGRKKLMVMGELLKFLSFVGMFITTFGFYGADILMVASFLLTGISTGLSSPAAEAMLIDLSNPDTRTFMYAVNYWANNLSITIGIIIGGWFYTTHFPELLVVLTIISFITFLITLLGITETLRESSSNKRTFSSDLKEMVNSYKYVFKNRAFVFFTIAGISILGIEFQRNNYISVNLSENFKHVVFFGNVIDGVRLLSLLTVENTLIIVFLTSFIIKFVNNSNIVRFLYTGYLLFGIGFIIFSYSLEIYSLILGVLILSIGEIIYTATRQTLLADIIGKNNTGSFSAVSSMTFHVGKIIGSISIILGNYTGSIGIVVLIIILLIINFYTTKKALEVKEN
ncbi:MFS transporter [Lysinibacillus halotolerans]|uniref:MFS transporter n=1 Tax=Lysinibacillus halotolerans TaxID=1368476 RepID=A0A3M8H466_9BACI|nr:MFS transporter [Lysinibacillus halotolerans]RNC97247.1 MFS transporter [Lysinibacillus halotolerans]